MKKLTFIIPVVSFLIALTVVVNISTQKIDKHEGTEIVKSSVEKGVEQIINRSDFQEKVRIEAEMIYWQEEKQRIIEEHDLKLENIESNLEELREKETSF